jgi:hypothetical protein
VDGRLVIHGSFLGGYGLPGMLAFVGVIAAIQSVLTRIWARPSALAVWVVIVGGALLAVIFMEAVSRRNVVEVGDERIRWSFRAPPEKGDQPFSHLQRVEVFPSGARLVFIEGAVFANRANFRPRDIKRLVDGLRSLGAQVNDMGAAQK